MFGGLILIYFVGKAFYNLAEQHGKSVWGFAVLGVLSYYAGLLLGWFGIGVAYAIMSWDIEETNDILLSFVALPVGVMSCWGFYKILQSQWSKKKKFTDSEVLDADMIDQQREQL